MTTPRLRKRPPSLYMGESEDDFALKPLFWRQQDVMCDSPKLTVVSMIMTEGEMPYVAFAFAPE